MHPDVPPPVLARDISPAALAPTPLATGAQQLRKSYKRNLGRGLVGAVLVHAAGLGAYTWAEANADVVVSDLPELGDIIIDEPPPLVPDEPSAPEAPSRSADPAPTVVEGTPTPVDDAVADPAATIVENGREPEVTAEGGTGIGEAGVDDGASRIGPYVPPVVELPPPPEPTPTPSVTPPPAPVVEDAPPPIFVPAEVRAAPLRTPAPEYPEVARQVGIEGRVTVHAWVTAEGTVREVRLLNGVHSALDRAAMDAVRRWTFSPAIQNGRAVAVWVAIPVHFRLN